MTLDLDLNDTYNEIRNEFLHMADMNREGFFISLEKAYKWLELEYSTKSDFRKNFNRRYLKNSDYCFIEAEHEEDYSANFIMRKKDNISLPWFSDDGFKILCMIMSRSPKTKYVLRYFIQVEKDYLRVLKQSYQENQDELNNLRHRFKKMDSTLLKTEDERDTLMAKLIKFKDYDNKIREISDICRDKNYFSISGNIDNKILQLLLELYATKVNIYLVNPEFLLKSYIKKENKNKPDKLKINKRKAKKSLSKPLKKNLSKPPKKEIDNNSCMIFDFSDSDEECKNISNNSQDEYSSEEEVQNISYKYDIPYYKKNFKEYLLSELEDDKSNYYYNIHTYGSTMIKNTENYHRIGYVFILDKNHYHSIMNELSLYKTITKNVYNISYNTLINISKSTLSERLRLVLLNRINL